MKFIRKKIINESIFKTPEQIRQEREERGKFNADVLVKDASRVILDTKKKLIEDVMLAAFINSGWWAHDTISEQSNLRPGFQQMKDFNLYMDNIGVKSREEKLEYLYKKVPFTTKIENGCLIVTVTLIPTSYPVDTVVFSGNALFNYLDKVEKSFNSYLKFPTKLKVHIQNLETNYLDNSQIRYIKIRTKRVSIEKFMKFMLERVDDYSYFTYEHIDFIICDRLDDVSLSSLAELGNYIKFEDVVINATTPLINRRVGYPSLVSIDGFDNLLMKDNPDSGIYVADTYWRNPEFKKRNEGKKYIKIRR